MTMSDPQDFLKDEGFQAALRSRFGRDTATLMTSRTNPEIMAHYSKLCTEKGITEQPIFIVEARGIRAFAYMRAYIPAQAIVVSSDLLTLPKEVIAACLGHEQWHFNRRQFLRGFLVSIGVTSLPLDAAAIDYVLQNQNVIPPHASEKENIKWIAALILTFVTSRLGTKAGDRVTERATERDCDMGSAEFAGPEATRDLLAAMEKEEMAETEKLERTRKRFGVSRPWTDKLPWHLLESHPRTADRKRHIERKFKIPPAKRHPIPLMTTPQDMA